MSQLAEAGNANHAAQRRYQETRMARWDSIGENMDTRRSWGRYYHRRITQIYRFLVPAGLKILELGCGRGDLLSALEPLRGVGVDFSRVMLSQARESHPHLFFLQADAHALSLHGKFDVIILSDLLDDLWDVETVFKTLLPLTTSSTRLILNSYSRVWELPLAIAKKLGVAKPTLYQNWLTVEDIGSLLSLAGFEIIRHWEEILWPVPTFLINSFCNRFLSKIWPFQALALTNFILARPQVRPIFSPGPPRVSVVIPARNEAENIPQIFTRTPEIGGGTELIFVEGHSKDDTYSEIERHIALHPQRCAKLLRQKGTGKGDAVREGFANAAGDILMILDADLTVAPEDLPRFYEALVTGKGEFVNGVRLVYPMEKQAMRFLNLLGNKFFSLAFSWLLGQPIKDTLCGTKVLWKKDYDLIAANRSYFGDFDPFGDFDLLFGAAKIGRKIIDLPIRYRERTYGTTNIRRWQHGLLLLRMVLFSAGRIKFV